jgi:hypothetical protein
MPSFAGVNFSASAHVGRTQLNDIRGKIYFIIIVDRPVDQAVDDI